MDTDDLFDEEYEETHSVYKKYLILFILFVFIVSDTFIDNVLANFGNTLIGRKVTPWGIIIQGLILIIAYAATLQLTR